MPSKKSSYSTPLYFAFLITFCIAVIVSVIWANLSPQGPKKLPTTQVTQKDTTKTLTRNENQELSYLEQNPEEAVIAADLNHDGKQDTIRLNYVSVDNEPGKFDSISIELTDIGQFGFTFAGGGWDSIDESFLHNNKNDIKSNLVFVKTQGRNSIILLFGYEYGSGRECSLLKVEGKKASLLFSADLQEPKELKDMDHDGYLEMVALQSTEAISDEKYIYAYSPYFVYTITDSMRINKPLMKRYNEENYIFAGYTIDYETIVVDSSGTKIHVRKIKPSSTH